MTTAKAINNTAKNCEKMRSKKIINCYKCDAIGFRKMMNGRPRVN